MTPARILNYIDKMIDEQSVLQHPFYQAMLKGELSSEALAVFAWGYYPYIETFPYFLELALIHPQSEEIRNILLENLREELAVPAPHTELWLSFAQGLGLDPSELLNAQILPEVAESIDSFSQLCRTNLLSALLALYTYERQQPELSAVNLKSLQEHYNIHSAQALSYFSVHLEIDLHHREENRRALELCLSEEKIYWEKILSITQKALDAHWCLFNGICRQAGIPY